MSELCEFLDNEIEKGEIVKCIRRRIRHGEVMD